MHTNTRMLLKKKKKIERNEEIHIKKRSQQIGKIVYPIAVTELKVKNVKKKT